MVFVRWVDGLNRYLMVLLALMFVIMTISTSLGILSRFLFSTIDISLSVPWTEELSRYLMIWSVFIGGAVAARNDKLISVEALIHSLPSIIGKIIKVGALLITIVFFTYLIFLGFDMAFNQGLVQTSPVMELPMVVVYSSMLVGAILTIINIVALLLETSLTKKDIRFASMEEEKKEVSKHIEEQQNGM